MSVAEVWHNMGAYGTDHVGAKHKALLTLPQITQQARRLRARHGRTACYATLGLAFRLYLSLLLLGVAGTRGQRKRPEATEHHESMHSTRYSIIYGMHSKVPERGFPACGIFKAASAVVLSGCQPGHQHLKACVRLHCTDLRSMVTLAG